MDRKLKKFLLETFPQRSYYATLKIFLQKQRDKGLSPHTIARQFYNLHPIGKPENPPIDTYSRAWLKTYVYDLRQRYAPDTVRTAVGDIRQFFKWCKKKKFTEKNLAKPIKPIKRKIQRRRKSKAPAEDTIKILMRETAVPLITSGLIFKNIFGMIQTESTAWDYSNVMQLRDLFILTFIYETGARAGELAQLSSRHMDTATANPAPIYMITVYGKTNDQDYYFTNATAELWHIWQQVRPDAGREFAVISWLKGQPPTQAQTNTISQMMVRRCKKAGLRPFRAHSLRHAKTKRSRKMVGIELTSFLIGHADIDTTVGYDFVDDEELIRAVKRTGMVTDIWKEERPGAKSKNGRSTD